MLASNLVLNRILDRMLQLLPDEPADSKRLDDIVDTELKPEAPKPASGESVIPSSGAQEAGSGLRAAS